MKINIFMILPGNAAMALQDRDPASDPEQEAWVAGQR